MRERSPDGTQVVIDGKGVGHGILYPLDWFDQNAERQGLPEPIELPAAVVAELLAANICSAHLIASAMTAWKPRDIRRARASHDG